MKYLAILTVGVVGLAGCGGQARSHSATSASQNPDDVAVGKATGQAFVKWETAHLPTYPSSISFANDYRDWITGKNSSSVVNSPLNATERHAAAQVALSYAASLIADGKLPANDTGGQNTLADIKAQGVQ